MISCKEKVKHPRNFENQRKENELLQVLLKYDSSIFYPCRSPIFYDNWLKGAKFSCPGTKPKVPPNFKVDRTNTEKLPNIKITKKNFYLNWRMKLYVQHLFQGYFCFAEHFLSSPNHTANDMILIPIEKIFSNRDSIRKAREAFLIQKGRTIKSRWSEHRRRNLLILLPLIMLFHYFFTLYLSLVYTVNYFHLFPVITQHAT